MGAMRKKLANIPMRYHVGKSFLGGQTLGFTGFHNFCHDDKELCGGAMLSKNHYFQVTRLLQIIGIPPQVDEY